MQKLQAELRCLWVLLPSSYELEHSSTALDRLSFNKISATLKKSVKIDLGGMGKGFGVDKVSKYFRDRGDKRESGC